MNLNNYLPKDAEQKRIFPRRKESYFDFCKRCVFFDNVVHVYNSFEERCSSESKFSVWNAEELNSYIDLLYKKHLEQIKEEVQKDKAEYLKQIAPQDTHCNRCGRELVPDDCPGVCWVCKDREGDFV